MGGTALKNTETRRYDRDEYFKLEADVVAKLKAAFPFSRVEAVKAYRTKPSFGDMDVLVEVVNNDWFSQSCREDVIKQTFSPNQLVKNGSVVSFDYRQFQIDILFTPTIEFNTAADYFAWNDLGNFVGRLSHKLGFKYGHDGLSFVFRDGDYEFATISVSRNTAKTFQFLDLDYKRFVEGFDTMEDVFKFASSSKYFNKHSYDAENRNHRSNTRDKKRKSYHDFGIWMNSTEGLPEYPWDDLKEQGGPKYKEQFINLAFDLFPDFKAKYEQTTLAFQRSLEIKAKFNGHLVNEWTGLQDKELGKLMQAIRAQFDSKEKYQSWVLETSTNDLKQFVLMVLNTAS